MKKDIKLFIYVILSIFSLYLAITYWPAISNFISILFSAASPIFIGCIIAYIINILSSFYERKIFAKAKNEKSIKFSHISSVILALLTLIIVIVLVFVLVIPQLVSCIEILLNKLPVLFSDSMKSLKEWGILPEDVSAALNAVDWKTKMSESLKDITSGIGGVVSVTVNVVSSVVGVVVTICLSTIFSIYLLFNKKKLLPQIDKVAKTYVKESWYDKAKYFLSILNDSFHSYIVGQSTEAVVLGTLCTIGMLILGLPYATMIGPFIAVMSFIPIAGAYIGGFLGAFMIFTVDPFKALVFVIFLILLQQFEGNIIYPRVVGSSIGLPGMWVLAAVIVGGGVGGMLGMLVAVPIMATIYKVVRNDVQKRSLKA